MAALTGEPLYDGPVTALAFSLTLGQIERFAHSRQVSLTSKFCTGIYSNGLDLMRALHGLGPRRTPASEPVPSSKLGTPLWFVSYPLLREPDLPHCRA